MAGVLGPEGQKNRKYKNRKGVTICKYPDCGSRLGRMNKTGLCRHHFLKTMHEDEAWETEQRRKSSDRLKAMHTDKSYSEAHAKRMADRMRKIILDRSTGHKDKMTEGLRRKFLEDEGFRERHASAARKNIEAINSSKD